MNRLTKILLIVLGIIVLAGILLGVYFWVKGKNTSTTKTSASTQSPYGTMLAYNINDASSGTPALSDALKKGWTQFRQDDSAYENLKSNLNKIIEDRTKLVKTTGFTLDRELVPYFTWNVIEPQKGQFDWELTDLYAKATSSADIKISAVIQPFASWDQKNTTPPANCNAFDFAYYDYKVGPPKDTGEYQNFLTKTVERYKDKVAVWEVGNEYDGPCGGYQDNPQGYFDLLKITSETIKKADPKAIVTNGGASEMVGAGPGTVSTKNFWTKFFALGGSQYIDYFNFHYNTERSQDAKLDPATFQEALASVNDLMKKNGDKKPLYLTEFGVYSGKPSDQPTGQTAQGQPASSAGGPAPAAGGLSSPANESASPPTSIPPSAPAGQELDGSQIAHALNETPNGQSPNPPASSAGKPSAPTQNQGGPIAPTTSQNLPEVSQASQAALYFKNSILAFASGVNFIFIDLVGADSGLVASSMAFDTDGTARLFLTSLKTVASKVGGFSQAEKIADGQYRFIVAGKTVYALWSGTLPSSITGKVKVTDIKGKEQTIDSAGVKPSADQPILIEL